MKKTLTVTLLLALARLVCLAQLPVLQITTFNRSGTLTWTNRFCTTDPVYEVLQARSVTGPWEHAAFVTNQTSFTFSNPLGENPGAVFYRLACVSDVPLVFDYAFDEGYGFTAVAGRLSINLFNFPGAGSWAFQETGLAIDERHPTGAGPLTGVLGLSVTGEVQARYYLTPWRIEGAFYLEGTLRHGEVAGRCAYTEYSGTVYEVTFGGSDPIGTFVATRVP